MKLTMKAKGMGAAQQMMQVLKRAGASPKGATFLARTREEKPGMTNREVLEYLAEPKSGPKRDMRHTEEDSDKMAREWLTRYENRLRVLARGRGKLKKKGTAAALAAKHAKAANASAFRAAGNLGQSIMRKKLEDGKYDPVGAVYARRRSLKYGVPDSTSLVGKASGQLLRNVQDGQLKLNR